MNLRSPHLYLIIVPFMWSTNFVLGKILVRGIPPLTLSAIRFTVATLLLAILLQYYEKKRRTPERRQYLLLLIMGVTGILGFNYLLYSGLRYTTSTNSAIINAFYPAITTILSGIFIKEQFNNSKLFGLVFSLAGVLLITTHGSLEELFKLRFNLGDILVFLAAASWAVYSITGKFVMGHVSPLLATTYSCFFGLIFLYPAMFLELSEGTPVSFSWQAVVAIIYLGVMAVLAQFLWNRGVQEIGPDKTAYYYNLMPLFTAILASLFLGEEIHWYHLIGGAMVLLGVFLGSMKVRSANQTLGE